MSSGHDHHDNHSKEPKTVSFRTPMILGLVTILIIVLSVNACDKKNHCCEDGAKCEQEAGGHGEHGGHEKGGHEEHMEKHDEAAHGTAAEHGAATDSVTAPAATPTETPAAAAHH
jgi:hypothetical protein